MEEQEIIGRLMKKQLEPGELYDRLKALKVKPTYGNGIYFQLVKKAAEGDLSAAKYILGAVQGEPPAPMGPDLSQVPTEELRRMVNQDALCGSWAWGE